jgi:L-amino acid N-acyltransferase YncA
MSAADPLSATTCPVRAAEAADLPRIVEFEVDIARVSFGADAVITAEVHARRITSAMGRPGEIMLVVGVPGTTPLGWAWLSRRTNSLTGAQYCNFRSLAVADHPRRTMIGQHLMAAVLDRCRAEGLTEVVGKVHAANLPMRTLYRAFDFEATHLTMRKRMECSAGTPKAGER